MKTCGWLLLIGGLLVQAAETTARADAQLNNVNFNDSGFGKLVGPVEKVLPISFGWALTLTGAAVLWVVPLIKN